MHGGATALKKREMIRALLDAGFVLMKSGAKHDLYKHETGEVMVMARGTSVNPRSGRGLRAVLRRVGRGVEKPQECCGRFM